MLCYNVALILIWSFFFDDKSTGNLMHSIGGIIVSILAKFWIAMVWYLILFVVSDYCIHIDYN